MEIKDNIKKLLELEKWSVYRLSKESGLAQSTLSDILNGKNKNPNLETLDKIADALNVLREKLIGESVGCILHTKLKEVNMTLEELAEKTNLSMDYLKNIDHKIPDDGDYDHMKKIAAVLNIHPGSLRAALARQEPPIYDDPTKTVENDYEIKTLAAHYEGEEWTEEELKEIENFKNYVRSKRKNK